MDAHRALTAAGTTTRAASALTRISWSSLDRDAARPTPVLPPRQAPANALTAAERARVLAMLDGPEFVDAGPAQVYAALLDRAWEAAPRAGLVDRVFLPPLGQVLARWWQLAVAGDIWLALRHRPVRGPHARPTRRCPRTSSGPRVASSCRLRACAGVSMAGPGQRAARGLGRIGGGADSTDSFRGIPRSVPA